MPAELIGTPVNTGTGLGVTATSITFARPSNALQVGDYVVAIYSQRGAAGEPSTPPSGWTATGFISNSNSPGGGSGLWYKRFATQSEIDSDTSSYAASFSARALVVTCVIIRGANSVSGVTNDSSNGTPRNVLTYTSINAATAAIALTWLSRNAVDSDPLTAWTPPAGFTELLEYNDFATQEVSHGVSYKSVSSGATGTASYTYSFSSGRLSGGLILFYDATENALSGAIAGTSGVSGALTVDKPLSATIAAVSGLSGDLTTEKPLAGNLAAIAGLSGALAVEKPLNGQLGAIAGLAGSLSVEKPLTGAIAAVSGLTGALNSEGGKELAGAIAGDSSLTGALTTAKQLGGTVAGASGLSGAIAVSKPLSGAIAAVSSISGALDGQVNADLSGVIVVSSAMTGALTVEKRLAGTIAAISGASGELSRPGEGIAIAALVVEPPAITALVVEPIRILVTA